MAEKKLRSPIVSVLGHVDHGKTTLLDYIRKTRVAAKEYGGITQHIGASFVPLEVILHMAKPLIEALKRHKLAESIKLPGLLFIDLPGHEVFSNLRRRGSSVADLAILVIDVNEGIKEQTIESIELLRARRVPFVVAANKIDLIPGRVSRPNYPVLLSYKQQPERVRYELEKRVYDLVGQLAEFGFDADLYRNIKDFRKKIPIIPTSGVTGEGVPDLLLILLGVAQRFMGDRLKLDLGPAKGVVLETKKVEGAGRVIDVILYDGILRRNDLIVLGGKDGPIITRIRALLMPEPLEEIRVGRKFRSVEEVVAAAGVRIVAPNLEKALAGSPLYAAKSMEEAQELAKKVVEEIESITFKTDKVGVIVKADTLGTLEALVNMLKRENIPVRLADVGDITKSDVFEAIAVRSSDKYLGVILGFNVDVMPEAKRLAEYENIPIILDNIIYRLVERYQERVKQERERDRLELLKRLVYPAKIKLLPGYVFRTRDPAIVGIEVLGGTIRPGYPLMRPDGKHVGEILQIQSEGQPLEYAKAGDRVAISIRGPTVGRQIRPGMILYTDVPKRDALERLTTYSKELSPDEKEILREIIKIKRKTVSKARPY